MRCKRCGRENPSNVKRCMYCNTPFYGSYSHVNMPQNRKQHHHHKKNQNKKTDTAILASIIALVLVFTTLVGVYAFQNFAPRKKGFSSGGGGGGISATSNQPVQPSNNVEVSLDGDDPDVEIYSFNTDTYDILVGETKTVTFTAEIFENVELSDTDVMVVDNNNNRIGYMNDAGVDGDRVADDGIYTYKGEFSSSTVKNVLYQAKANRVTSETINICYYREFSDEDLDVYEQVVSIIDETIAAYVDESGYLPEDKYNEAKNRVSQKLNELKSSGLVKKYSIDDHTISIELSNGIPFAYELTVYGTDSGLGEGRIATYQPFKNTYSDQSLNEQSDAATDGSARNIAAKFHSYSFGNRTNFDLDSVTLENLKNMSQYSIIAWHGHGGYNYKDNAGSCLAIGQKQKRAITKSYSADITANRVHLLTSRVAGRKVYAISGGFVDKYVGDMTGAMVYLAACDSGKDMDGGTYQYRLARSFINKGAMAVVANTETICTDYNTRMERDVFARMQERNDNSQYYNLSEALSWAKQLNGNYCCQSHRSEPKIYPQNNITAQSYRLYEPCGNIAGSVKCAETGEPIANALVRVYQNNTVVKKIRTGSNGYYNSKLPEGEYVVKITAGHYKSAKVSVTVTENITTYVETLLMLEAGINSGYANGTITDATTGDGVAGVSVKLRKSWNNKDGAVLQTTSTNENGYYEFSYNPGFYTIEYSKNGYITGYKNIIIGIVDYEAQNAVISPEMPDDGNFRIVLSWSSTPKDLDSHLTGPTVSGSRFHLYYKYANTSNQNSNLDYYQLDLDNTDIVARPNVPETTTIVTQLDGVYRYSVHDYTNRGRADSEALSQSNATVNVYKGSVLVATYHVPPNVKGSIWTVFELSGNEIKPINTFGNGLEDDISKF